MTLEIVHRYVEQMDKYYGNVCELDIIFNFQKAYFILDELLLAGEMQESSKKNVLRCISQQDSLEDMEVRVNFTILYNCYPVDPQRCMLPAIGTLYWQHLMCNSRCFLHHHFMIPQADGELWQLTACAPFRLMRRSPRLCDNEIIAFVAFIVHV